MALLRALFAGAISPSRPAGDDLMRRVLVPSLGAVALAGGLAAALVVAPCAPPFAPLAGLGFGPAHCAGPRAAEAPRAVAPPTVTVVAAVERPFVDRLFVSGTLVAREEAQVAAQIDGLTIVEIDAEEGDSVAAGQVLARLDRSQIDAQLAQNDAATARADAAIAQAKSAIDQAQAQLSWASDDYDRAAKLGPQVIAAATIEQRETALAHRRAPSSPRLRTRSRSPKPTASRATASAASFRSSWRRRR